MNDYIAGCLGAAGFQAALIRRAIEGIAFDKNAAAPSGEQHQLLAPETITAQTRYSELVVVRGSSKSKWSDR